MDIKEKGIIILIRIVIGLVQEEEVLIIIK